MLLQDESKPARCLKSRVSTVFDMWTGVTCKCS